MISGPPAFLQFAPASVNFPARQGGHAKYCSHFHGTSRTTKSTRRALCMSASSAGYVWYFAYGSNMNPRTFGPDAPFPRNLAYMDGKPAVLHGYRLTFDVAIPGSLVEPCFANIRASTDSSMHDEVHGVLYQIRKDDFFGPLARSEGFSSIRPVLVTPYGSDEPVFARTLLWENTYGASLFGRKPRPSRRYINKIREGAAYWKLERTYSDNLKLISTASGIDFVEDPKSLMFSPSGRPREDIRSFAQSLDLSGETRLVRPPQRKVNRELPLLVYLPGLDGTGLGILPHLEALEGRYEVMSLVLSHSDSASWSELIDKVSSLLAEASKERSTSPILLAESLGAALALGIASREQRDQSLPSPMLLVNPATSFRRSAVAQALASLPFESLPGKYLPALPLLFDIPRYLGGTNPEDLPRGLLCFLSTVRFGQILPAEVLQRRLDYLRHLDFTREACGRVQAAVQIIASDNDNLLPSQEEAQKLSELLPNALDPVTLAGGGHCAVMDCNFDIVLWLDQLQSVSGWTIRGPSAAA